MEASSEGEEKGGDALIGGSPQRGRVLTCSCRHLFPPQHKPTRSRVGPALSRWTTVRSGQRQRYCRTRAPGQPGVYWIVDCHATATVLAGFAVSHSRTDSVIGG